MRTLLAWLLLALILPAVAHAEPPTTGFEDRNGASFTTYEEEQAFLQAVASGSPRVGLNVVGTTKENRPLDLVEIGAPGPAGRAAALGRPTVLMVCSQHGNEPAGREACLKLLRDLAFTQDPALVDLLTRTTFLFVPSANPDGRAADQRENRDDVDINRDHLSLDTPEARAMAAVVRDWEPDVAIDLHEYGPSQPVIYDDAILWLWPRNLNADAAVHDLAIELGRQYMVPAAQDKGYTTDEYGQAEVVDNDIAQTAGDGDEGIMRNAMGLRHVLGILVESRVDADIRQDLLEPLELARVQRRRVDSHLSMLEGVIRFMSERGADAAKVTADAAARKAAEGAARSAPVYFGGADNTAPAEEDVVNPPPCGYALTTEQVGTLAPRLELHGIRVDLRAGAPFVSLGQKSEPVIPLLLDARGTRHKVEGTALDDCAGATSAAPDTQAGDKPGGGAAGGDGSGSGGGSSPGKPAGGTPTAPTSQPSCDSTRTVSIRLPKLRGKVYRTRVVAAGRRARVRRGVAYVDLRRPHTTVKIVIRRRVVRKGKRVLVRQVRTVRVCPR